MKKVVMMIVVFAAILNCSRHGIAGEECNCPPKQVPPHLSKKKDDMKIDTSLLATNLDLVCKMNVKNKIVDTITYSKKLYGFCGTGCKKAFLKSPGTYVKK